MAARSFDLLLIIIFVLEAFDFSHDLKPELDCSMLALTNDSAYPRSDTLELQQQATQHCIVLDKEKV